MYVLKCCQMVLNYKMILGPPGAPDITFCVFYVGTIFCSTDVYNAPNP